MQNNNVKWPNFALLGEREPRLLIFFEVLFHWIDRYVPDLVRDSLGSDKQSKWLRSIASFEGKM